VLRFDRSDGRFPRAGAVFRKNHNKKNHNENHNENHKEIHNEIHKENYDENSTQTTKRTRFPTLTQSRTKPLSWKNSDRRTPRIFEPLTLEAG
jgi:hypothetical protein